VDLASVLQSIRTVAPELADAPIAYLDEGIWIAGPS
jgi:hypothetical protein